MGYLVIHTLLLGRMCWEDFSTRTISLWLFVLWGVLIAFGPSQPLHEIILNISLALSQVLVIFAYVAIKSRGKSLNILAFIGLGDLLFIALAAVQLPMVLFQVGLVASLLLSLVYGMLRKAATQPLAGVFALVTLVIHWLNFGQIGFFTEPKSIWP